jgi:hypothetical protein
MRSAMGARRSDASLCLVSRPSSMVCLLSSRTRVEVGELVLAECRRRHEVRETLRLDHVLRGGRGSKREGGAERLTRAHDSRLSKRSNRRHTPNDFSSPLSSHPAESIALAFVPC